MTKAEAFIVWLAALGFAALAVWFFWQSVVVPLLSGLHGW